MTAAAVFTHHNQTWTQPVTLVRKSGSEIGWLEMPHEKLTSLEIAGYRHRWDRMVWEVDRRKVDFFWPRAAAFVQQRWAELHPDEPALQEVRFAKALQRASNPAVRNPQGHWALPPVAELPRKDVVELARCRKSPAVQAEGLPFRGKEGIGAVLKQRQAAGEAAALQEPVRWVPTSRGPPLMTDALAWYCVHTKPKCEHLAAGVLRGNEGIETFCPRLRFQRNTRRGKIWFVEALFPSYFFARFDATRSLRLVRHSQSVLRVVEFSGEPIAVPDGSIEDLRREMDGQELREVKQGLKVGDVVEVTSGPMRGFRGILNGMLSGEERVRILLDFLGRQSLVEVAAENVIADNEPRVIAARR